MRLPVILPTVSIHLPIMVGLLFFALALLPVEALARDKVLVNGKIFTANPDAPFAEAIAIRDDRILAVGTRNSVVAAAESDAEIIDLAGQMLLPGLIDSHTHAVFGGFALQSPSLNDEVLLEADLKQFANDALQKGHGAGSAMRGDILYIGGANSAYWSQIDMLDRLFNMPEFRTVPVVLAGSDYHTGWANAAMLKRAGVDSSTVAHLEPSERGIFGVRSNGEPNGFAVDAGWDRISASVPQITDEQLMKAGRAAVFHNNSNGITAWLDAAANALPNQQLFGITASVERQGVLPIYRALSANGELTAHVAAFIVVNSKAQPGDLKTVQMIRDQYANVDNLSLPGIKIFADGVLEYPGQTAALTIPYKNSGKSGATLIDPQGFTQLAIAADRLGLVVHVHAIGDRTVREVLDGFEAVRRANGNSGLPHTITHLQIVSKADVPRFAKLGVIASMQLLWALGDVYTIDLVKPYIDDNLFQQQYPARSLFDAGAIIAGASDWPVSSSNPFEAIYEAVTRKGPKGVLNPDERMPRLAMLYAYTRNAARAMRADNWIGTLAPAYKADMVLIDRDLTTVDEEAIKDTRVLWTMFGGRIVYRNGDPAP